MALPGISRASRNAFREILSGSFVLREISDIFTGAGFPNDVTYQAFGNRRQLVEDYYRTRNFESQPSITMLLSAINEAVVRLAGGGDMPEMSDLVRLMKRDGYVYRDGEFIPERQENTAMEKPIRWSMSAYNLICHGLPDATVFRTHAGIGTFARDRLFEYTSDDFKRRYEDDIRSLEELPALIVAEAKPGGKQRTPAFLAFIDRVRANGNEIRFRFRRMQTEGFSSEEIFGSGILPDFDPTGWECSRTHWAIKEGSLIESLLVFFADRAKGKEKMFPSIAKPRFFSADEWPLPVLGHVAVMMPFDPTYDAVYETIRDACSDHNLEAIRVDEIYGPKVVVDDIFKTIVQSRFVICDLTKRNPNVLYETGIAHARNRDVLMIVQDEDDIPFDLQHIRFVKYLPNSEGYSKLREDLVRSIDAMLEK